MTTVVVSLLTVGFVSFLFGIGLIATGLRIAKDAEEHRQHVGTVPVTVVLFGAFLLLFALACTCTSAATKALFG